jgi:hypothetical protein
VVARVMVQKPRIAIQKSHAPGSYGLGGRMEGGTTGCHVGQVVSIPPS